MSNKKFILNSDHLGRVTLQNDPEGWDVTKVQYSRNLEYIGVFRKRTATLRFIGDGLQYCIDLFKIRGTEAVMNVIVMQKVDYEDAWELEFEGIGKFNPFGLEWGEDLSPSLSIEFEDSGFHNKFMTRAAMDINIGQQLSVEGVNMGAMPTKNIQVHQRVIVESNLFRLSANNEYTYNAGTPTSIISVRGHVIPAEKFEGDSDFVNTPTDYLIASPGLMCEFVSVPTAIKVTYHLAGENYNVDALEVGWYVRVFHDEGDLTNYTDTTLFEKSGLSPAPPPYETFDFNGVTTVELNAGEAFTLIYFGDHNSDHTNPSITPWYYVIYSTVDVTLEVIQNFNEYVSTCHYRHEFMKRIVQLITDQTDCFNSTVFGREEIGYEEDGAWWNNVCFNGKQLRGFADSFPVRSFKKSFKSARAIWNVGCGIERFGARFKVVVEDISYFFRGDISITLHNVRKVKRDISENFTFSEVHVGYEKAEYEEVNGLEEYNNKSKFATYIKSADNILDLISPDRGDGYGMEFLRRKSKLVAASEDTSDDDEVFTAMVDKDGELLRTQKDGNYDAVDNIVSSESATNLDITPTRNLLRNGDWISGCCYKFPAETLKFLSADKETDLSTTRTGESSPVVEQASMLNSTLKSSLWLNLEYPFEADITPEQVRQMDLKPNSLIKFSPFSRQQTKKYYYGWVMDANVGGKERSGTFVLLAANINSDRLKIIDPEGVWSGTPETPTPPGPPPSDYGFEYGFEHEFEA